jgi:hypothetical protein
MQSINIINELFCGLLFIMQLLYLQHISVHTSHVSGAHVAHGFLLDITRVNSGIPHQQAII